MREGIANAATALTAGSRRHKDTLPVKDSLIEMSMSLKEKSSAFCNIPAQS